MSKAVLAAITLACFAIVGIVFVSRSRNEPESMPGTSQQALGLRVTGLGKTASVRLPRQRVNRKTTYVFGSRLDVRKPLSEHPAIAGTTIATYTTNFEEDLFADLVGEGGFIEDVSFWVSETGDCGADTTSKTVHAERFFSEVAVVPLELGGRRWHLATRTWRLHETGVNKVTYSCTTTIPETGSCVALNTGFSERIAPPLPGDRTKYAAFDASPRAQGANAKMRDRLLQMTRNAALTFSIR